MFGSGTGTADCRGLRPQMWDQSAACQTEAEAWRYKRNQRSRPFGVACAEET